MKPGEIFIIGFVFGVISAALVFNIAFGVDRFLKTPAPITTGQEK